MWDILKFVLCSGGVFFTLIGILTFWHIFIEDKSGEMDSSNRINHMRLWWFALTRPEEFVDKFPWLKNDEWDNFEGK